MNWFWKRLEVCTCGDICVDCHGACALPGAPYSVDILKYSYFLNYVYMFMPVCGFVCTRTMPEQARRGQPHCAQPGQQELFTTELSLPDIF